MTFHSLESTDCEYHLPKSSAGDKLKPNRIKRQKQRATWEADETLFRHKITKYLEEGKELHLKPNCKLEDGKIMMQCVQCKIFKERIPRFFSITHHKNFVTSLPGREYLQNSAGHPCHTCFAEIEKARHASGGKFLLCVVGQYPKLSIEWLMSQIQKQNNLGMITGTAMEHRANSDNAIGIHRFDNARPHTPDNVFLEVQELNVPQHDMIPSLQDAWQTVFQFLTKMFVLGYPPGEVINFEQKSRDRPIQCDTQATYLKQLRAAHLFSILNAAIVRHIRSDVKAHRIDQVEGDALNSLRKTIFTNAIRKLKEQQYRCHYSLFPLSILPSFARFSFERIDNSLTHFTPTGELTNIAFVCRLFNGPKQMSRKKLLTYYLSQQSLYVPIEARKRAEDELMSL
jgi:hypothetical protein